MTDTQKETLQTVALLITLSLSVLSYLSVLAYTHLKSQRERASRHLLCLRSVSTGTSATIESDLLAS